MGLARSRAVEQFQAAVLCRDAVTIMVAQSSALDSGSIAAAAVANKRLERDPTEQASRRQSGNSALKPTRTERRLRSESPEPPDPARLPMAAGVGRPGHP